MKKIWIAGANGHTGSALSALLREEDAYELYLTDKEDVDITDRDQIEGYLMISRPDVVINCAGITDQDYCLLASSMGNTSRAGSCQGRGWRFSGRANIGSPSPAPQPENTTRP